MTKRHGRRLWHLTLSPSRRPRRPGQRVKRLSAQKSFLRAFQVLDSPCNYWAESCLYDLAEGISLEEGEKYLAWPPLSSEQIQTAAQSRTDEMNRFFEKMDSHRRETAERVIAEWTHSALFSELSEGTKRNLMACHSELARSMATVAEEKLAVPQRIQHVLLNAKEAIDAFVGEGRSVSIGQVAKALTEVKQEAGGWLRGRATKLFGKYGAYFLFVANTVANEEFFSCPEKCAESYELDLSGAKSRKKYREEIHLHWLRLAQMGWSAEMIMREHNKSRVPKVTRGAVTKALKRMSARDGDAADN